MCFMALGNIRGNDFKKMIMRATGTKGYISSSVQKSLQQAKAQHLLQSNTQVSRQKATKIIRQLKSDGLAHKVTNTATNYIQSEFAKEERRQENIKRKNLTDRKAEIESEKNSKTSKKSEIRITSANQPNTSAAHTQAAATPTTESTIHKDTFVGSSFGNTNLKPTSQAPVQPRKPKKWEEEDENLIDLVID